MRPGHTLTVEEVERFLEVILAAFDRWPNYPLTVPAIENLRWRLEGPGDTGQAALTLLDGQIIGGSTRWRRPILVKGVERSWTGGGDSCIHPDYQGLRIQSVRRKHEEHERGQGDDRELTLGGTKSPASVHLQARDLDRAPFANRLETLFRPLDPQRMLADRAARHRERLPRPLKAAAIVLFSRLTALRHGGPPRRPSLVRVQQLRRFDQRFDGLYAEAAPQFDFIVVRSSEYLTWRYLDPRAGNFTLLAAEEGGRLLGYIVMKTAGLRGYIADILALPGRIDAVRALLAEAVAFFAQQGCAAVQCWMVAHHPYNRELKRLGFIDARQDAGITARARRMPPSELRFVWEDPRARIHMVQGDFDFI